MTRKIACCSDLHGRLPHVEVFDGADIVVIAGDICPSVNAHQQWDWLRGMFCDWLMRIHVQVVMTWGNHDWAGEQQSTRFYWYPDHVVVLTDDAAIVRGVNFFGIPWSLPFNHWAFNATEQEIKAKLARVPPDTHVLISHGPPFGMCDHAGGLFHAGSRSLQRYIQRSPSALKLVVCGHIHEAAGRDQCVRADDSCVEVVNAALVDLAYQPVRDPVLINIEV